MKIWVKWRDLSGDQLDKKTLWTLTGGALDTFQVWIKCIYYKNKVSKLGCSIRKIKNKGALGLRLVGATALK